MAAPPNFPPIPPQIEPTSPRYFGFDEPPPRPAFMTSSNSSLGHTAGQNYDRSNDSGLLPPPPPPTSRLPEGPSQLPNPPPSVLPPQDVPQPPNPFPSTEEDGSNSTTNQVRRSYSHDGSGSDHSDSEEEEEQHNHRVHWQPLAEDRSLPCEDELALITARAGPTGEHEHSALQHRYWERKTFFEIDDPEIVPGESGRIDWLVERFNGTEENPNMEDIMWSPTITVGGYEWRIRFYPKGNNSEYLSAYIECITMQSSDFDETVNFTQLPLPFVKGTEQPRKRRSIAVQFCLVMYNPAEPRVYHYCKDAHQFTKQVPDYGWPRFTRHSRRDFGNRTHGQRQSILRNDKLAFSAYIRVVHDPTGCMWSHSTKAFDDSIEQTGLRPFSPQLPWLSALLPLLHFAPFRNFIYGCRDSKIVFWFHTLLWKMMSRKSSEYYSQHSECRYGDTITWMKHAVGWLRRETSADVIDDLLGTFASQNGAAVGNNRLETKSFHSVQAAINAHSGAIEKPALLTLELERSEFDRDDRRWKKLTNKVEMEDRITVGRVSYTLFAFSTHCGDLESNKFNLYIRPNGPAAAWYAYTEGRVACKTRKQSVERYCGYDDETGQIKKLRHSDSRSDPFGLRYHSDSNEVANVVMYMRDDCVPSAAASPPEEAWEVPENVRKGVPPTYEGVSEEPPATATYERFSESVENDVDPSETVPGDLRKSSFTGNAGYATPSCWQRDGEDVVMNDADDVLHSTTDGQEDSPTYVVDHFGRAYYEGKFLNQKYHGQGHLISMNGDEYIGTFKDGEKCGKGKMIYASTGDIYEGKWEEDDHHGTGTLTDRRTGNVFEGGWKWGRKHGQFVLKGTVTDDDDRSCRICKEKDANTAIYDCGHVVLCKQCATKVDNCPICRKPIMGRLQLFGVKMVFE